MSPEVIAEICHEANRLLTRRTRDVPVQPPWSEAPEEMVVSSIQGVRWRIVNPLAPASSQHEEWMRQKLADGWVLGPTRDAEKRTHPALIPYADLPKAVQQKDALFTAIVLALRGPP